MLRPKMLRWLLGGALVLGSTAAPEIQAEETRRVFRPEVLNVQATARVGEPGTVPLLFHPPAGWHIDPHFPLRGKVFAPAGVTSDKVQLRNPDARLEEREGQIDLVLTARDAGKKTTTVVLSYGIVSDSDLNFFDVKIINILVEMSVE